jgi:rubrerythrin
MYYCNDCDIAHETKQCPLCEAEEKIRQLEKDIEELTNNSDN